MLKMLVLEFIIWILLIFVEMFVDDGLNNYHEMNRFIACFGNVWLKVVVFCCIFNEMCNFMYIFLINFYLFYFIILFVEANHQFLLFYIYFDIMEIFQQIYFLIVYKLIFYSNSFFPIKQQIPM
jgi:hypothetical protein